MYTELTIHKINTSARVDTRKFDIAKEALRNGNTYEQYRSDVYKNCSPYIDNPMLLTEHQYYQLTYSIKEI